MIIRLALYLFTFFFFAGADKPKDGLKKELDSVQGDWKLISLKVKGEDRSEEYSKRCKLKIVGNEIIAYMGFNDEWLDFKFDVKKNDTTKKPKTVDLELSFLNKKRHF